MAKRYYKVGESVWVKETKKVGKVVSLNVKSLEARISVKDGDVETIKNYKFMDIDKLREKNVVTVGKRKKDVLNFAKVRPSAIIPSKRKEDAGYDLYANFEGDQLVLPKGKPTLVPTGLASAFSYKYYLNLKHERGSTGLQGMAILSGVVDSGYRGEIFVNICPTDKDVVISKTYDFPVKDGKIKPVDLGDKIMYPYALAVAQATLDIVPNVDVVELSYDELKAIGSERGAGKLGDSGK